MAEYVLGISAFYHDSAACLLKDGVIVAAAQEERFTRVKQDKSFPKNSIQFCLNQSNITIQNVDSIVFYEKPILKFYRILNTHAQHAPKGFRAFSMAMKSWLKQKLWIPQIVKRELGFRGEVCFVHHHESHAASAYFSSSFDESAFLTIDGVGEMATTTYGVAKGNKITTLGEIHFPHSLGLLYSAFTFYCGFKVNSGEYKLMGLAPYGTPIYVDKILNDVVKVRDDGSIKLNLKYFSFEYGLKMINAEFEKLFENPARLPESELTDFYNDIAASIQVVTEQIVLKMAKFVQSKTGQDNLCLSGGVALNCVANGNLLRSKVFKNIWISPFSGDAGGAVGAAFLAWHNKTDKPKISVPDSLKSHSYLGPEFSSSEIETKLKDLDLNYHELDAEKLKIQVARDLTEKQVVGWFSSSMEFGPRALGARTILASPVFDDMQSHLNLKIKKREGFRPFAPVVLEEHANKWFGMERESKTMLYTYNCLQPEKIPSCVHVDGTSRVQTLSKVDNEMLYGVLEQFNTMNSCPVLINTSFNERGEPIVCSPIDAIQCFFGTEMDVLVLGNFVVYKSEQTQINLNLRKYEMD